MSGITWDEGPLRQLLVEPAGALGQDLARRGARVESAAKENASGRPGPKVQSGRLRSSIRWVPGNFGGFVVSVQVITSTGAAVTIGTDVEYGGFVELGTSRAPAYPYLQPALGAAI